MRLRLPSRKRATAAVAINVDEPNVLDRIAAMNATLIEVTADSRLVQVRKADYRAGEMEVVVEAPERSATAAAKGVIRRRAGIEVTYQPLRTV